MRGAYWGRGGAIEKVTRMLTRVEGLHQVLLQVLLTDLANES